MVAIASVMPAFKKSLYEPLTVAFYSRKLSCPCIVLCKRYSVRVFDSAKLRILKQNEAVFVVLCLAG